METQRERDALMVEAGAAVDYIMRERLIDTGGWLVWMTMVIYKNSVCELWGHKCAALMCVGLCCSEWDIFSVSGLFKLFYLWFLTALLLLINLAV